MSRPEAPAKPELLSVDFDERPFTVAWELTRSCALACLHCRAEAQPRRHPDELTTDKVKRVTDELVELAPPVLVLTGGDPMMRPDLFEIVEYAVDRGLRVSVSPTTTALTTKERLARLRDLGVPMIHISLDGTTAETHDRFRGFPGTFARAMQTLDDPRDLGVPVQVGTTVTRHNVAELPQVAQLMEEHGVRMWNLFSLVPTGRGRVEDMVDAQTPEDTWEWFIDLDERAPFGVRTTAAPQFRRTMLRRRQRQDGERPLRLTGAGYQLREAPGGVRTRGVNDGKGFMFIDHLGNICPSGFLQIPGGNVRTDSLASVYRGSELFRTLRDPSALSGRCGRCEYADLCGGSRARAFGVSGSYHADDPLCALAVDAAAPAGARTWTPTPRPTPWRRAAVHPRCWTACRLSTRATAAAASGTAASYAAPARWGCARNEAGGLSPPLPAPSQDAESRANPPRDRRAAATSVGTRVPSSCSTSGARVASARTSQPAGCRTTPSTAATT